MIQPIDHIKPSTVTEFLKYGTLVVALFFFIGCDQLTKEIARRELSYAPASSHVMGLVIFQYAENQGSFMSIGAGLPEALRRSIHVVSAFAVMIGFVLLLTYAYQIDRVRLVGFCLLLAGACGNLLDRFNNDGRVIDFIVLKFGSIQTGVFNLADVFIMTGLTLVLLRFKEQYRANH